MADKPVGELASELADQVRELVRTELQVAATELREKAARARLGGALVLVGAVLFLYAVGVTLSAVVLLLSRTMPPWLAAAVVGSLLAAVAAVAGAIGLDRLRHALPLLPEQAAAGIAEDARAVQDRVADR